MTIQLFNDQGEAVEALSPEELENQVAQAVTAKEQEYQEHIQNLQKRIEHLDKQDRDFAGLRQSKEIIEAQLKEIEEAKIVEKAAQEQKRKEDLIGALAGGDEDLKGKIEYHYSRINEPDAEKRVNDALKLAMADGGASVAASVVSSAGGGSVHTQSSTPEGLAGVAKNMGLIHQKAFQRRILTFKLLNCFIRS